MILTADVSAVAVTVVRVVGDRMMHENGKIT